MEQHNETDIVFGVNPIRELLRAGTPIERAFVCNPVGQAGELIKKLRAQDVPLIEVDFERLRALCAQPGNKEPNHQGLAVRIAAVPYAPLEELLATATQRQEPPLLLLLDGVTDPHNFGAIIRSAEAMGAHGVIVGKRRSVGLTGTVFRASSGAAAHLKVAQVGNLVQTLEQLKTQGLWVVGTDMDAPVCEKQNLMGPLVLCIGSEGEGLSRLVRETCDLMVGIPLLGATQSLNAACAASVLIYEVLRQRRAADAGNVAD